MTPKEKAQELVYIMSEQTYEYQPYAGATYKKAEVGFEAGKQCALIAVEEILSMGIMSESGDWKMAKSYWQEVKQEIENT